MNKRTNLFIFILLPVFFYNCATARVVRPLEKKQVKVSLDLGGPFIVLKNVPFPVPFSSASVAYGFEDNITGFASAYITEALFGVIHMDMGTTFGILKPNKWVPGISLTPAFSVMADIWKSHWKFYPTPDINLYWDIKPGGDYVYIGLTNWFELEPVKANGSSNINIWVPSLNLGYTFVVKKWMFTVEAKYMGFTSKSDNVVVDYVPVGQTGTIGLFLSAGRLF